MDAHIYKPETVYLDRFNEIVLFRASVNAALE